MYSIYLLSFVFLLFVLQTSATSYVAYPVSDQLPLIARVGQPYSWSISTETFATSETISASPLPSWLSFSNYTFSGTPGLGDEGSVNVTLQAGNAHDSFALCVTHFPPPTIRIPISSQFNSSNPSMSSVFPIGENSALKSPNPALRIPLRWSFSVGFQPDTFVNDNDLFYYVQLANGSRLPEWLRFDNKTVTIDGVARTPPLMEGDKVELVLIASDQEGYSAVRAPFDLFIQSHDLSVSKDLTLNLTAGEDFQVNLGKESWFFDDVVVDQSPLQPSNISSLSIDSSSAKWVSYDDKSRTLSGTAPSTGMFSLPMSVSAFSESFVVNTTIFLVPSYFRNATLSYTLVNPGTEISLQLPQYFSSNVYFAGHNVTVSASSSDSFLNVTAGQNGSSLLSGRIPGSLGASHFDVQLTAYDHTVHAISLATLRISIRSPNDNAREQSALARHRRLVLGLSIGLGGAAGLILFAGFLALVRKFCRVKDTALDVDSLDGKTRGSSDGDIERDGYGWSEKAGLNLPEVQTMNHARYQGVGIGYTPSLVPGSPPATRITKAAFFNNIKAAVRKFSVGSRSTLARKSAISKPVLMFTKDSNENLRALRTAAGLEEAGAVSYIPANSAPNSIDIPPGDGISLGMSSGLGSSPTSTTGHSNETGKASIPRQRADFGPPRQDNRPSNSKCRSASMSKGSHARRRSMDTQATGSSGDREHDAELAEAVIVTASRATSLRSARSSAYSCTPSAYTRDSVHAGGAVQVARPRLVPFTNARGVPVPTPTVNSLASPAGPREQRRVSQIAAVVAVDPSGRTKGGAHEADTDAIMTEGIRYVRAFGDQNTDRDATRHATLAQNTSTALLPSRSNSKRSSRSMTRVQDGFSPTQTQSSYVFPSPSQSIESSVRRGGDGGSRGSRGSRGSLMMSRILVRSGEAFAFKYPIALPSSVEQKLFARPLHGGSRLPSFLSHSVSMTTPSLSNPGKKRKARYEVEFWGTPSAKDVGEIVVGIFTEGNNGECVGRLVVEVVSRG